MGTILAIENLNFQYDKNLIFNNFNLSIEKGKWITLIGPNGSGKSTLVKIIVGILQFKGNIIINDIKLNKKNINKIRKSIGVLFETPDQTFVAETVLDELAFALENLNLPKKTIQKRIMEVSSFLNITHLLKKYPGELSGGEKQLVALGSVLVLDPQIIILDESINRIDLVYRKRILNILKKLNKQKNITIINVTHEIEEVNFGDDIIVLVNGNIVLKGPKELVLLEEKVFNTLGLELPFITSLSLKLKHYELIDKLYFNMDELVDAIWK